MDLPRLSGSGLPDMFVSPEPQLASNGLFCLRLHKPASCFEVFVSGIADVAGVVHGSCFLL